MNNASAANSARISVLLWMLVTTFPLFTIVLPLALVYWLVIPVLAAALGPIGVAMGSWLVWALVALGIISSVTTFLAALNYWRNLIRGGIEIGPLAG